MDPFSITVGIAALLGACYTVVKSIKEFLEKTKMFKDTIRKLLQQAERVRFYLDNLRILSTTLVGLGYGRMKIPVDLEGCQGTFFTLQNLAKVMRQSGPITTTYNWLAHHGEFEVLESSLKTHEDNIFRALIFIAANSAVKTQGQIHQLKEQNEAHSQTTNPFEAYKALLEADEETQNGNAAVNGHGGALPTWFGQLDEGGFSQTYAQKRNALADAAKFARWDVVLQKAACGTQYREIWMNSFRIKPNGKLADSALWTPLHQAAFLRAPEAVVKGMIEKGALRSFRTNWADNDLGPYKDLTAGEIARALGYIELAESLAPVVRYEIPSRVLWQLEEEFHKLIEKLIDDEAVSSVLLLPQLVPLTELEPPVMWFPIRKDGGFLYRLDQRDLVVEASRRQPPLVKNFRITSVGTAEVTEPLVFASS